MTSNYPNIDWFFSSNIDLEIEFNKKYSNKTSYLKEFNTFLGNFRNQKSINEADILDKIKGISELSKLGPFIAELETLLVLLKHCDSIMLLPDSYYHPNKSPDILFKKGNLQALFEVTNISDGASAPLIYDDIRNILSKYPYVVEIEFKDILASPSVENRRKKIQGLEINNFLELFQREISKKITDFPYTITTSFADFTLNENTGSSGYIKQTNWSYVLDVDYVMRYIDYRLSDKAKKQPTFPSIDSKNPYIIVLGCEEISISDIEMKRLLYGKITSFVYYDSDPGYTEKLGEVYEQQYNAILADKINSIPKWDLIEQAAKKGWNDFLIEQKLIPNDMCYLKEEGIFLSKKEMENVTGVLFIKRKFDEVHYYPNPFCKADLNNKEIYDILK